MSAIYRFHRLINPGNLHTYAFPHTAGHAMDAWMQLVKRYANGRNVCNCGEAYYTNCGTGTSIRNGERVERTDIPVCKHGCSANKISARDEIAGHVLLELGNNNG